MRTPPTSAPGATGSASEAGGDEEARRTAAAGAPCAPLADDDAPDPGLGTSILGVTIEAGAGGGERSGVLTLSPGVENPRAMPGRRHASYPDLRDHR